MVFSFSEPVINVLPATALVCLMTNLDIKKQRHYLPTKVHLVKAVVFPVVMLWMLELDC